MYCRKGSNWGGGGGRGKGEAEAEAEAATDSTDMSYVVYVVVKCKLG